MNWEPSDTARLKDYHKKSGGRLRAYLASIVPAQLGNSSIEQVALAAKYKEGCEFMLRAIDNILSEEQQPDDGSSSGFTSM